MVTPFYYDGQQIAESFCLAQRENAEIMRENAGKMRENAEKMQENDGWRKLLGCSATDTLELALSRFSSYSDSYKKYKKYSYSSYLDSYKKI